MREQQMAGVRDSWDNKHVERWRIAGRWKNDLAVMILLTGFALWINQSIQIQGLCTEDLRLWSCYGELPLWKYLFSLGNTRFLYHLAVWLELKAVGTHITWIVPVHLLLNAGIAFTLYRMGKHFSHSFYVGLFCGLAFLASRMSYYQIGRLSGLMEIMALWMAIGILYLLCVFSMDHGGKNYRTFYGACGLYLGICLVHERFWVLFPLFLWPLLCRKVRKGKLWAIPVGICGAFQMLQLTAGRFIAERRFLTPGQEPDMVSVSFGERIQNVIRQGAYLFGIHTGPGYLSGPSYRQAPLGVMLLIGAADLMLLMFLVAFFTKVIQEWKHCGGYLSVSILFIGFVLFGFSGMSAGSMGELYGAYVSYGAGLLYLSWMYGVLTERMVQEGTWMQAVAYLAMLFFYGFLMFPAELYYREFIPNLSCMLHQQQYNSLAEETYGTYGDQIFGKTIYVIGNDLDVDDFTRKTFFKVFDSKKKAEGTSLIHVDDIRQIGLISGDMLVLQEEPERNGYQDVTHAMRQLKCRGIYGYYEDGWMDEQAKVQVMAGSTGVIEMEFFYPGELEEDQWITIYVNGEPEIYLEMEQNPMRRSIQTLPFETLTLEFRTNFYIKSAREQRGETRLAAILAMWAD